jgi:O-antigen/teichoic acid export membrane protein
VIAFVSLVGEFFKVRVGIAATILGARSLDQDVRAAAGVFQFTYLIDLATGVIGFVVVAALAPFVGPSLIGDNGTTLILLFALTLLASAIDASSLAILRLLDRFRLAAGSTAVLEALRIGLVVAAAVVYESLAAIVIALIIVKFLSSLVRLILTARAFAQSTGTGLLRPPGLRSVSREVRKEMWSLMFHTNVWSYGKVAQHQLPPLVLGAISGATETGLYKVGMAAASLLGKGIDPASAAITPRIARLWAAGQFEVISRLIRQASLIAGLFVLVALLVVVPLRDPILEILGGGPEAQDAGAVLILGALGYALYGVVFWHTNILWAAGRGRVLSVLVVTTRILQVLGVVALAPSLGATGAALAFLISNTIVNASLAFLALRTLGSADASSLEPAPA